MTHEKEDRSNGYEVLAAEFIARRSGIGAATVRSWAGGLPAGASVLDLGCGHGVPVSATLVDGGFAVCGIDASPSLLAAFRARFPQAEVACEAVEDSAFFGRTFDGIVAVGLVFLLPGPAQRRLIDRVARALKPGGRFLFTAPTERGAWKDVLTNRDTVSLGAEEYATLLSRAGLRIVGEYVDEGDNHYYDCIG